MDNAVAATTIITAKTGKAFHQDRLNILPPFFICSQQFLSRRLPSSVHGSQQLLPLLGGWQIGTAHQRLDLGQHPCVMASDSCNLFNPRGRFEETYSEPYRSNEQNT